MAAWTVAGVLAACSNVPETRPTCLETGCGPHGTCSITGPTPVCECEIGYTGPVCATCAPGFQDEDGNGFCAGSCAGVACGAHERCNELAGRPVCGCVVGYSRTEEGRCAFTGGPVDPSFTDPEPNGWATSGGAKIEIGNPTDVRGGRGWARISGLGEVFQSFEMPTFADAEPLALELELACSRIGECSSVEHVYSIAFDDRLLDRYLPRSVEGTPEVVSYCLGEQAFGRLLRFGLRTYPAPGTEGSEVSHYRRSDAFFGRAQFVPSPACPAPGTVKNGDFEAEPLGPPKPGVDLIEENGNRSARLTTHCGQSQGKMETSISVPTTATLPRPALAFSLGGSATTEVHLDGHLIGLVPPVGAEKRAVVCLPEWSRGHALDLTVGVEGVQECAPGTSRSVRVDDFVVVSDPSCVDETVPNGGFERPGGALWTGRTLGGRRVVRNAKAAHSGEAYLEISADARMRSASAPLRAPGATGGAALKFWYRLPRPASAWISVGRTYWENPVSPPPSEAWSPLSVCLPRHSWGRTVDIEIYAQPADADGVALAAALDLDDLEIAPDPSCPLE
ncbi:MAG: hypothetical protein KF764_15010 [Labilithrix sp.]|nr:hypothetical protein [Labilithrix sp.]